jgi:hypothetical protein
MFDLVGVVAAEVEVVQVVVWVVVVVEDVVFVVVVFVQVVVVLVDVDVVVVELVQGRISLILSSLNCKSICSFIMFFIVPSTLLFISNAS